jgi:predicted TIM-barrel fold metal-dependent hydrolase
MSLTADDVTVFDNVVHVHNIDPANMLGPEGEVGINAWWKFLKSFPEDKRPADFGEFAKRWSVDEVHKVVFDGSTDFAMAQTVPLFDIWKDGLAAVERQHALKAKDPERVVFVGGTDPVFNGVKGSVEEIERQIEELGARSMKFYNAHSRGRTWRCDDPVLAYPMYTRALELGVNLFQFHKGGPLAMEKIEDLKPNDLQQVATDFPEANIIIHHLAAPYTAEAIDIARRWPNVYLSMSTWINELPIRPALVTSLVGEVLARCGPEKLIFGSELPLWPVARPLIDMVLALEMPNELQDGYGYPEITDDMRRMFMGGNLMRLMGMDPDDPKL